MALEAALRMANYLRMQTSFEVVADTSIEEVLDDDGAKLTFTTTNTYRVRRPDRFFVEVKSDRRTRRYFYDGRSLTVDVPRQNFYAQVSAPGTIEAVLDDLYDRFGIALPLSDIFYWGLDDSPPEAIKAAVHLGSETIEGIATDHYFFRGDFLAWQVWIEQGDRPFPRKVVITTLSDPAKPTFSSVLTWRQDVSFPASTFAFSPERQARPIALAEVEEASQ